MKSQSNKKTPSRAGCKGAIKVSESPKARQDKAGVIAHFSENNDEVSFHVEGHEEFMSEGEVGSTSESEAEEAGYFDEESHGSDVDAREDVRDKARSRSLSQSRSRSQ